VKVKTTDKTERFITHLQQLLKQVRANGNLKIHQEINESFYMQKIEEFKFLCEQLRATEGRLEEIKGRIMKHYIGAYPFWKRDARWLNNYLRNVVQSKKDPVV